MFVLINYSGTFNVNKNMDFLHPYIKSRRFQMLVLQKNLYKRLHMKLLLNLLSWRKMWKELFLERRQVSF